jgi:hypothetical protein
MNHLLTCPACGPFSIRARRRNRRAEDAAHIRFFAQLAAEVRAERRQPRITLCDPNFRRIGRPMTFGQLAEAGIEVAFA